MMKARTLIFIALLLLLIPDISSSQIIRSDDFESYSDTSDMEKTGEWAIFGDVHVIKGEGYNGSTSLRGDYTDTTNPHINWQNIAQYELNEFYISFWTKIENPPASGGSKYCKIFGKIKNADTYAEYANTTFNLHYDGGFSTLCFGDGSELQNDTGVCIRLNGRGAKDIYSLNTVSGEELVYLNKNDNDWHFIELYMRYNTDGNFDGAYKIWIDGDLKLHVSNLKNRHDENYTYPYKIKLGGYGGRNNPDFYDHPFSLHFDEITLSTHRINANTELPSPDELVIKKVE